jgi:hypothetical protein
MFGAQKQRKICVNVVYGRFVSKLWLARLTDLNSLDFYLWGRLKIIVYATAVNDVAELQQRVQDQCELIRYTPEIFECV